MIFGVKQFGVVSISEFRSKVIQSYIIRSNVGTRSQKDGGADDEHRVPEQPKRRFPQQGLEKDLGRSKIQSSWPETLRPSWRRKGIVSPSLRVLRTEEKRTRRSSKWTRKKLNTWWRSTPSEGNEDYQVFVSGSEKDPEAKQERKDSRALVSTATKLGTECPNVTAERSKVVKLVRFLTKPLTR